MIDTVLPSLTQYEDVLITREESKIYKEIDKVLGQAMIDNIETGEEVERYEMVDVNEVADSSLSSSTFRKDEEKDSISPLSSLSPPTPPDSVLHAPSPPSSSVSSPPYHENDMDIDNNGKNDHDSNKSISTLSQEKSFDEMSQDTTNTTTVSQNKSMGLLGLNHGQEQQQAMETPMATDTTNLSHQLEEELKKKYPSGALIKVRKPIIKKTFALKKIGYKVIPYEDESDSRYSFTNENVVFVNKANSTYRAEATRGDEFLLRHIIGIVAEAIAQTKHPEGKDALEFQNRLVSEAIRIHDYSLIKK
jgi:hypothetical protein